MLFQWDLTRDDVDQIRSTFWEVHDDEPPEVIEFADTLIQGAVDHVEEIDPLIERHAENWRLERMATVEPKRPATGNPGNAFRWQNPEYGRHQRSNRNRAAVQ